MVQDGAGLSTLRRPSRRALREMLIRATIAAEREGLASELDARLAAAPVELIPAAASLHRVTGSVRRGLRTVRDVPEQVTNELSALTAAAAVHHLGAIGALSEIAGAFDAAGLAWVAIKGPIVSALLYPDIGDRGYGDIDLLVHHRDFPTAIGILEDLGYRHSIRNWALAESMLAGQLGMASPTMHVDAHWQLHYAHGDRRPYDLRPEEMLERSRRAMVSGLDVPTLDPTDTLLTLAFHAARSDGHALVWYQDIVRSFAADDPDLDELVRRCDRYRCGPPVGLVLERTNAILDASIPDEVVGELLPRSLRVADRAVRRVSHPIRLHERPTVSRLLTRSVGPSIGASVVAVPSRTGRWLRRTLAPPPENETDDAREKASYLEAVASSFGR